MEKTVCTNKKARHLYDIEETLEAGIVLLGPEVESLRLGRANLADSFARIKDGEVYLYNVHISPYPFSREAQ
ncbi:MAG TPA: SsrA-binding protein, partial [Thermodesulfatator atlanticus]|nr:SsrA-binding protein [Thermodesulfatator atlanticus]